MMNTEQRNCFLKIKAVANAIDLMLANENENEASENINTLSMMLVELCDELDRMCE